MRDDAVYVGNVGCDSTGSYLDVRCGDSAVHVGQSLWTDHNGSRLEVTVTRIEVYGREFRVLDPGLTARVWVSPGGIASLFSNGTRLVPDKRSEK